MTGHDALEWAVRIARSMHHVKPTSTTPTLDREEPLL